MRNILVTGCSTGFGQDIALRLLEDKNNFVIATMRNAGNRDHAFKSLTAPNLKVLSLDITNAEERKAVVKYVESELDGKLHALVNNAGLGHYGALELTTEKEMRDQMEVNFFATSFMIQSFLPFLRKTSGSKKIINISSMLGQVGMPLSTSYSASKHALEGLVEALHYELAPFGIDVTTVCPGRHRTNFMKNISWSSLEDSDLVYKAQEDNLRAMMAKFADSKEIPLSNVSKRVIKLINARSTPSRVYVGSDAVSFYFLRKAMPFNILMKVFKKAYSKLISKRMSHANV
jgi:NAD(P)-dependent dehydrogenase (short-subunit alcohol dehydrogenase family)